jgi:GGDEF domain-containing protein
MTFSHDGLRDSLTHLAAPPYFYENLRRELAALERNKSRLSLIKFLVTPNELQIADTSVIFKEHDSKYESAILSFAELLKASTRSEDLCARLGRFEFTLILKGPEEVAESLASRVLSAWAEDNFKCQFSILAVKSGESSLEILNRLDNQELTSGSQR